MLVYRERTQNLIMKKSSTIIHASNFAKEGNSMDFSGVVIGAGALLENLGTWMVEKDGVGTQGIPVTSW